MPYRQFTQRVIAILRQVPAGTVTTYGEIADLAGNPKGARQVARILHACSEKEHLPWHRVINRQGRISLGPFEGQQEQRALLESEGIRFAPDGRIDLNRFLWRPAEDRFAEDD